MLVVDGACGVGAPQFTKTTALLTDLLKVEVRNNVADGVLNHLCGAEHAQKSRTPPARMDSAEELKNLRLCSFDGDADRLVYHYFDGEGNWKLLDGDAIACLCGVFFADQLAAAGLTVDPAKSGEPNFVNLGLVQTAYANGASTKYIKEQLKLPVPIAKTGVRVIPPPGWWRLCCPVRTAGFSCWLADITVLPGGCRSSSCITRPRLTTLASTSRPTATALSCSRMRCWSASQLCAAPRRAQPLPRWTAFLRRLSSSTRPWATP